MIKANIGRSKYRLFVVAGKHELYADEPAEKGGTDTAPSPSDLLQASLASCTLATLRMYADRKEWPLESADVVVEMHQRSGSTSFTRQITLHGELSHEQKERLLQIARLCPVSKILEGSVVIESSLK